MATKPTIGSLRHRVTFYKIVDGIRTEEKPMYAGIIPTSTSIWQRSNKTMTHFITMPDGTTITDTYKIVRLAETHPNEFLEIAVTKI
jgi:hypothetical protein